MCLVFGTWTMQNTLEELAGMPLNLLSPRTLPFLFSSPSSAGTRASWKALPQQAAPEWWGRLKTQRSLRGLRGRQPGCQHLLTSRQVFSKSLVNLPLHLMTKILVSGVQERSAIALESITADRGCKPIRGPQGRFDLPSPTKAQFLLKRWERPISWERERENIYTHTHVSLYGVYVYI